MVADDHELNRLAGQFTAVLDEYGRLLSVRSTDVSRVRRREQLQLELHRLNEELEAFNRDNR
jgi:hypothetical protein